MASVTGKNGLKMRLKSSDKSKDGKDLYAHISSVMSHVVRHQPANAVLDNLEEVSVLIKKSKAD